MTTATQTTTPETECPDCATARCVDCDEPVDCGSYDHSGRYRCDDCQDCGCCGPSNGCERAAREHGR